MSRFSELKAIGTVSARFSNSPITRDQGAYVAGTHRDNGPFHRDGAVEDFLIVVILIGGWLGFKFGIPQLRAKAARQRGQSRTNPAARAMRDPPALKRDAVPPLPELTDREHAIGLEATAWAKSQIGDYLGQEPQPLPDYGPLHDIRVAAYVCGFIEGQNQALRTLEVWSKGDQDIAYFGFIILASGSTGVVLGMERSLEATKHIPAFGCEDEREDVRLLYNLGGADGFNHAKGEPKEKGGMLRDYLANTVQA